MTNKLVKKEESRPCGCHIVEFSDDTNEISPCPPCGFKEMASHLGMAARIMAAVAFRLERDRQAMHMAEAIASVGQRQS